MTNTKFLVRVNRSGTRAPEYVQRIDRTPIQTTTNRKLALAMGRFPAEDPVKSIQNSRCTPELISVQAQRGLLLTYALPLRPLFRFHPPTATSALMPHPTPV